MQLKDWRQAQGLTLAQLAERIGVSEVSASRYERGRMPRAAILQKIKNFTEGKVLPDDWLLASPAPKRRSRKRAA